MDRQTTEEDEAKNRLSEVVLIRKEMFNSQEWNPHYVLEKGCDQSLVAQTILQESVRDVTSDREDEDDGNPNFERWEVDVVDGDLPAQKEVVEEGERE